MRARFIYRAFKARWRDQRGEMQETLRRIRPGETVVDIGAHKGAYLYWMRKAVGERGKVLAFEPQPALYEYLSKMVPAMGWSNVQISPLALSDRKGTVELSVPAEPGGTSPGASLEPSSAGGYRLPCAIDSLDNLYAGRQTISFIKCDVEGHELSVFKGAARILEQQKPAILVECEERHLSTHSMRDVFDFLLRLGYGGQFFAGEHLRPLSEFDPQVHQSRSGERFWDSKSYFNNFLFSKPASAA